MAYNHQTRLRHVADRLNTLAGESATYRRRVIGGADVEVADITVHPILGSQEVIIPGVSQLMMDKQMFMLDLAELTDAGLDLPDHGDQIDWNGKTYNLNAGGADEPVFRYTTSARDRIMVFADVIGDA